MMIPYTRQRASSYRLFAKNDHAFGTGAFATSNPAQLFFCLNEKGNGEVLESNNTLSQILMVIPP
jgi:hypothetical protein